MTGVMTLMRCGIAGLVTAVMVACGAHTPDPVATGSPAALEDSAAAASDDACGGESMCLVLERLRALAGTGCVTGNTDTLMGGVDLSRADQQIAALGGPGRWLEPNRTFVGSRDEAVAAFGGELIEGEGRDYMIIRDRRDGIPYAQQLIHLRTPGGLDAWVAGDQIRVCGDNWE